MQGNNHTSATNDWQINQYCRACRYVPRSIPVRYRTGYVRYLQDTCARQRHQLRYLCTIVLGSTFMSISVLTVCLRASSTLRTVVQWRRGSFTAISFNVRRQEIDQDKPPS
ncbi:hypothetical protein KCP76_12545 [Salmonella enterica subsp. enterica serovar Weltevreden]|nr:hypothetical protein KCP76_12545 [Salmonella enterica subsp. enterica serovar Weltevreden]